MEGDHKCGKIWFDKDGVVHHDESIIEVGDCGEGCCTDYHCTTCGKDFRVEWPQ